MGSTATDLMRGLAAIVLVLVAAGCDGNLPRRLPDSASGSHDRGATDRSLSPPEAGPDAEGGVTPDACATDTGAWLEQQAPKPDSGIPDSGGAPDGAPAAPDSGWGVADAAISKDATSGPAGAFGAWCGKGKPPCASGLICVGPPGGTGGFCTKSCPKLGLDCPGAPPGHRSACAIKSPNTKLYCAFTCYSRSIERSRGSPRPARASRTSASPPRSPPAPGPHSRPF